MVNIMITRWSCRTIAWFGKQVIDRNKRKTKRSIDAVPYALMPLSPLELGPWVTIFSKNPYHSSILTRGYKFSSSKL